MVYKKYLFIVLLVGVWSCSNDDDDSFLDLQYIQFIEEKECGSGGYGELKLYKRIDCQPCDYDPSLPEDIFCNYSDVCVDIHLYEDEGFFICRPRDDITIPDSILQNIYPDTIYINGHTLHAYKER